MKESPPLMLCAWVPVDKELPPLTRRDDTPIVGRPNAPATLRSEDVLVMANGRHRIDHLVGAEGSELRDWYTSTGVTEWMPLPSASAPLAQPTERFSETYCSQCGKSFGPGPCGMSHCSDHETPEKLQATWDAFRSQPICTTFAESSKSGAKAEKPPTAIVCEECDGRGWIAGVCRSGQDDTRCGACNGKGAFGSDGRPWVSAAAVESGQPKGDPRDDGLTVDRLMQRVEHYGRSMAVDAFKSAEERLAEVRSYAERLAAAPLRAGEPQVPKSGNGAASTEVEAPTDTQRLDWLEDAYSLGGLPKHNAMWRAFMSDVAHRGYRTAISAALRGKD